MEMVIMKVNEEDCFEFLKRHLKRERGLDCDRYKESFFKRRVAARLRATGASNYCEYLRVLKNSPGEYRLLFDELCINVTEFFRDRDVFDRIREEVLPEIISGKKKKGSFAISAWSAGCATGEEAYSIAILLLEALGESWGDWKLSVLGTDIDEDALQTAKKGLYGDEIAGTLGGYIKYFYPVWMAGRKLFKAGEILKEITRFRQMDLAEFEPVSRYDLIMCRNVLIYFSREAQARIVRRLEASLRSDGFLVLGKTEVLVDKDCALEPVFARERIYRLAL